jgi:hypothetical protein
MPLNQDAFLEMRENEEQYKDNKYIFDNGESGPVGIMFNLFDTFITGNQRTLKIDVPVDQEFDKLIAKFDCVVVKEVYGQMEVSVLVNGKQKFHYLSDSDQAEDTSMFGSVQHQIDNATIKENQVYISVLIHFKVDFWRRNFEQDYRNALRNSGVILRGIRIDNGMQAAADHLTFGVYLNEIGLSKEDWDRRYYQFWTVSQYRKKIAYQTVVETPLKNVLTNGFKFKNNYSSGDIYGDLFVTKSMLDQKYNMDMWIGSDGYLAAIGRDYMGMGSCSNQLSLLYRQT